MTSAKPQGLPRIGFGKLARLSQRATPVEDVNRSVDEIVDRIHLSRPVALTEAGVTTITSTVSIPGKEPQQLWIRTTGQVVTDRADSFVAMCVLPAMRLGVPIESEAPVSRSLLEKSLPAVQNIVRIWREDPYLPDAPILRPIKVLAPPAQDLEPGEGVGLFYSGGIDSNFSLIEARDEITHLIFIEHFEVAMKPDAAERASAGVRRVADTYGKNVIMVETNARTLFDGVVSWGFYHGSLMTGIALQQQGLLRKIHIASSYNVRGLHPWGSHPHLDPLWSTPTIELVHDRIDVTRLDKTAVVSEHPALLGTLRVCWNPVHNCGTCPKCVRTILALQALNRYEAGAPFQRPPIGPEELARLDLREGYTNFRGIEDYLVDTGDHPAMVRALRVAYSGWYHTPVGILFREMRVSLSAGE